jgi:hypothetical protein
MTGLSYSIDSSISNEIPAPNTNHQISLLHEVHKTRTESDNWFSFFDDSLQTGAMVSNANDNTTLVTGSYCHEDVLHA